MPHERHCDICKGWHDVYEPWPEACRPVKVQNRSHMPAPRVIGDVMEPVTSQLDGRTYDSKSRLRKTYKDAGVTEVGTDAVTERTPPPVPSRAPVEMAVGKALAKAGLPQDERLEV